MSISGLFLSFDGIMFSLPIILIISSIILLFPNVKGSAGVMFNFFVKSMSDGFSGQTLKFSSIITVMIALFLTILLLNSLSLFSYFYCLSSLPAFSMTMSALMWTSVLFISVGFRSNDLLVHLTPKGAPLALASVLMVIELISNLIRVITLGVRLMANLSSGHIILGLMASIEVNSFSFIAQTLLFLLEIMVALIQSYVFALLVFLYLNEA